jgi:hypothetical protein
MAHCRRGRVARRRVHWLRRPGGLPRGAYRRQYRAACCCLASFWEPPVSVHSSRALCHLARVHLAELLRACYAKIRGLAGRADSTDLLDARKRTFVIAVISTSHEPVEEGGGGVDVALRKWRGRGRETLPRTVSLRRDSSAWTAARPVTAGVAVARRAPRGDARRSGVAPETPSFTHAPNMAASATLDSD